MAVVKNGEVQKFKFGFYDEDREENRKLEEKWMAIKGGAFVGDVNDNVAAFRVTYEKCEKDGRKYVYVKVDARPSRRSPTDRDDPNAWFFEKHIQIVSVSHVVECALSIDLGNTRTVALLVDQVGEPDERHGRLAVSMLPMHWDQCPVSDQNGTFESVVSFVCPDSETGEFCNDRTFASFVKLGSFAVWNNRSFGEVRALGRYTLSSPKRYFWDKDEPGRDWIGTVMPRGMDSGAPTVRPLDGRMARWLAASEGAKPSRMPPACVLSAMVAEIYEQAIVHVSSAKFKRLTNDDSLRRISKVHVTYPSTLLPRERDMYEKQLREGLSVCVDGDVCVNDDLDPSGVTLSSDIDEASSVLAVYAYGEMRKSSASFWLQSVGRKSTLGYQARIAVIDIGGGTTDLSISSVEATMQDAGVDPFKASIDLLCRDGVNSAGDALMFEFIRTCVAKLGFEALWEASQIGEGALKREELLKRYRSSDHEDRVRELTRAFWFDLAVRVSVACDEALRRYPDGNVGANDLPTLTYNLNDDASEIWMRLFNPKGDEGLVVSEKIEVKITKEVFDSYRASVDKTFRRVARSFATSICAYDVDMVLFSGKTAEFQAVRDVFQQHMALPRSAIRCMADYEVGGWCDGLTDAKGRIADSKVSTALGGALYLLRTDSSVNMTFLDSVPDLPCEWGFVADHGPVAFARPIFDEGRTEKDVPLNGYRKLIARRTRFSSTAVLSYELRFKPGRIEEHGGLRDNSAWVRLVYDGNTQALAIKACGGMYTDFKEVALDDVECRVCSMNGAFMMDRIVDIVA